MATLISKSFVQRVTLTLCFLSLGSLALAQTDTEPRAEKVDWNKPIAVASIASIDRVLDDIDYLFGTINKPEYPAMIKGFLAQYRNLEGLDKTKPLGAFVFLNESVAPQAVVVGFIPVKSLDELTQTLGEVGFLLNPVEGKEDRYTLALPMFTLHIKMAHGYAFLHIKSEALEKDFYNPDEFTSALAKEYDIAGSLFLSNVPKPMRMMAVDLVSARVDEQLPQKPGEDDLKYKGRKETTLMMMKQFERVAQDGEQLTIGYNLSKENKNIQIHLGVKAQPGTPLGKEFEQLSKSSSEYSYLQADSAEFLGYTMLPLRKEVEQKMILNQIEKSTSTIPPILLGDDANPGPAAKILDSLKATVRSGKLDGHVQLQMVGEKKMAVLGAIKLADGAQFQQGLEDFFELTRQAGDTNGIEGNIAEVEGIAIHKISPNKLKEDTKKLFGQNPVVYIACGKDECWLAVGESESLDLLKKSIANGKNQSQTRKPGTAFLLSMKLAAMLPLAEENTKDPEFVESAKVAFASGGDLMTIYPKITADQASLNLEFGEGFIRLISLAIVNRK